MCAYFAFAMTFGVCWYYSFRNFGAYRALHLSLKAAGVHPVRCWTGKNGAMGAGPAPLKTKQTRNKKEKKKKKREADTFV